MHVFRGVVGGANKHTLYSDSGACNNTALHRRFVCCRVNGEGEAHWRLPLWGGEV